MQTGQSLTEIAKRLTAETGMKRDFLADTRNLRLKADGRSLAFTQEGSERQYATTPLCLGQIGERVGIPAKYLGRMATEAPELLATNINHWFDNKPEVRMLRCFDNGQKVARAFLSNRYRRLDNYDLAQAVLPKLQRAGCEVLSAQITDTRFYIQAATPKLEAIIEQEVRRGGHTRIQRTVRAGVCISNSELGVGAINVSPLAFDLVCTNGLIIANALYRHHVGKDRLLLEGDGDDVREVFSAATQKLDDQAFWAKVCDVVDAAMDRVIFEANIDRMKKAQGTVINKPQQVVELVGKRFNLSEGEQGGVLEHLLLDGDLSHYGLVNAVTAVANTVESYDRAIELERLGGTILELPATDIVVASN